MFVTRSIRDFGIVNRGSWLRSVASLVSRASSFTKQFSPGFPSLLTQRTFYLFPLNRVRLFDSKVIGFAIRDKMYDRSFALAIHLKKKKNERSTSINRG